MKKVVYAAVTISCLAIQTPSAATAQSSIQPSGRWGVDYRPDRCVLYRSFGDEQSARLLAISIVPGLHVYDVLAQNMGQFPLNTNKLSITALPSGLDIVSEHATSEIQNERRRLKFQISSQSFKALEHTSELVIASDGANTLRLAIGSSPALVAAAEKCEVAVLASWGVDPSRFRHAIMPGEPGFVDRAQAFRPMDYPAEAIRAHAEGQSVALLEIGPAGAITSCRTVVSSESKPLDDASCSTEKRFHYEPLRNAKGEPITSWTVFSVKWQLPR